MEVTSQKCVCEIETTSTSGAFSLEPGWYFLTLHTKAHYLTQLDSNFPWYNFWMSFKGPQNFMVTTLTIVEFGPANIVLHNKNTNLTYHTHLINSLFLAFICFLLGTPTVSHNLATYYNIYGIQCRILFGISQWYKFLLQMAFILSPTKVK